MSRSKVTRDKTGKTAASSPLAVHCKAASYAANFVQQQTRPLHGRQGVTGVHGDGNFGRLRAVYVW